MRAIAILKKYFHYDCAALRVASDSERCVAMYIATYRSLSFTVAHYRSQCAARRSAAVVETGLYTNTKVLNSSNVATFTTTILVVVVVVVVVVVSLLVINQLLSIVV